MTEPRIVPIEAVEISHIDDPWRFAEERRAEIEAYFAALAAAQPALYNGTVLVTSEIELRDGSLHGRAMRTDFASFLYWRHVGFPETGVRNLFGSAMVHSREGHLVYGIMADWTANAGRVYPPGGSLGPEDVSGRAVDVAGSIARELMEETGLRAETAAAAGLYAIHDGPRVSVARRLDFPKGTESLVAQIRRFIRSERKAELADVHVVRGTGDILPQAMFPYAQAYVRHVFGG